MHYESDFELYKQTELHGRYVTNRHIKPLLDRITFGKVAVIGTSVENRPIYQVTAGTGTIKILYWSQMHGNESTATKALFDLFAFLESKNPHAQRILQHFTLCFIPILNPDGAAKYTRENANKADLNRDFSLFTQPESVALFDVFKSFNPDLCFNLHDQRSIFGAGKSGKPATISFLSPAFNESLEWNEPRKKAATIINAMNGELQKRIPGQVGRFNDTFNENCVGDRFQSEGTATILVEAGHFHADYDREITRRYFFISLLVALDVNWDCSEANEIQEYLKIPQNEIVFYDFVYKNIRINYDGIEIITNFASQYQEVLVGDQIVFQAVVKAVGNLNSYFGHCEFDGECALYSDDIGTKPVIGSTRDFYIGTTRFINGSQQ